MTLDSFFNHETSTTDHFLNGQHMAHDVGDGLGGHWHYSEGGHFDGHSYKDALGDVHRTDAHGQEVLHTHADALGQVHFQDQANHDLAHLAHGTVGGQDLFIHEGGIGHLAGNFHTMPDPLHGLDHIQFRPWIHA